MDSHHHRRIQSPESYCWTTRQKTVPGRNCTCDLKVRNLAFYLLNYGDYKWSRRGDLHPTIAHTKGGHRFLCFGDGFAAYR